MQANKKNGVPSWVHRFVLQSQHFDCVNEGRIASHAVKADASCRLFTNVKDKGEFFLFGADAAHLVADIADGDVKINVPVAAGGRYHKGISGIRLELHLVAEPAMGIDGEACMKKPSGKSWMN